MQLTSRFLCNLVVPGAAKAGTSSLHELLGQHPNICMSAHKEPHFFSIEDVFSRGAEFHNSLFLKKDVPVVYGESSTGYMICEKSIRRISESLTSPKIIIVLRDPVERTFSHYRWRYQLGLERRSFIDAIKSSGYGYDPDKPDDYGYMSYLQFSKYSHYVPLWINRFGKQNVLILNSASMRLNASKTLDDCARFLRIPVSGAGVLIENNMTEAIVARPAKAITSVTRMVPKFFKESQTYSFLKNSILKATTRKAPLQMNEMEMLFVTDKLSEDIKYYRQIFPE